MNIELNDMLVFEDEKGNICQDCVLYVEYKNINILVNMNRYKANIESKTGKTKLFVFTNNSEIGEFIPDIHLKEIWHKVDEDTYRRVWNKENAELAEFTKELHDFWSESPLNSILGKTQTVTVEADGSLKYSE